MLNTAEKTQWQDLDRDAIKEAANQCAEELFIEGWGKPSRKSKDTLRWGKSGSKSVFIAGPKVGMWSGFSGGGKGDIFEFWAQEVLGMDSAKSDFRRVLQSLGKRLGVSGRMSASERAALDARTAQRAEEQATSEHHEEEDRRLLIDLVNQMARPIKGTVAETYLNGRGITVLPPPQSMAFLPSNAVSKKVRLPFLNMPSLIAWARSDDTGGVTGGQRIILNEDGTRALGVNGSKLPKYSFGTIAGSAVQIPAKEGEQSRLLICEGPETAATLAQATGCEVWAVLGATGFATVTPPDDMAVALCPDQDEVGSPAWKQFQAGADRLYYDLGCDLTVARAPAELGSKDDLNDTHQELGIPAVLEALGGAVPYERDIAFTYAQAKALIVPSPTNHIAHKFKNISDAQRKVIVEKESKAMASVANQWAERHGSVSVVRVFGTNGSLN